MVSEYQLVNVFGPKPIELRHEIAGFWLTQGALKQQQRALDRVDEVLFVVRHGEFALKGVCTVFERYRAELGFVLYHFRSFVAPDHRGHGLDEALLMASARFLNKRFVAGQTAVRGLLLEAEGASARYGSTAAVWSPIPFIYVGRTERGAERWLYYFDGAGVTPFKGPRDD